MDFPDDNPPEPPSNNEERLEGVPANGFNDSDGEEELARKRQCCVLEIPAREA